MAHVLLEMLSKDAHALVRTIQLAVKLAREAALDRKPIEIAQQACHPVSQGLPGPLQVRVCEGVRGPARAGKGGLSASPGLVGKLPSAHLT